VDDLFTSQSRAEESSDMPSPDTSVNHIEEFSEIPPLGGIRHGANARLLAVVVGFVLVATFVTFVLWKFQRPKNSDADTSTNPVGDPPPTQLGGVARPHIFVAPTDARPLVSAVASSPPDANPTKSTGFVASMPLAQPGATWRVQEGRPALSSPGTPEAQIADENPLMVDALPSTKSDEPTADPFSPSHATRVLDPSLTIAAGSVIGCALETSIDSTRPGLVTCVVTQDAFSDNARLTLIERGTHVVGEYRADVRQGEQRISVLWRRMRTPAGATIELDSQATDATGSTGIPGSVDNHWFDRIGSAFLLSFIEDGIARVGNTGSATTVVLPNTTAAGATMGGKVLDASINIAPTITVPAGARINILVARDLDFRRVYGHS
jgi:type IV secretion system protein VirB10